MLVDFEQETFVNMTDAGLMLGLPTDTVSKIVDRKRIPTRKLPISGKGKWIAVGRVQEIADGLGIEVKTAAPA